MEFYANRNIPELFLIRFYTAGVPMNFEQQSSELYEIF